MNGKMVDYQYTQSGLPNIWIRCRCVIDDAGERTAIIPNVKGLHKAIACEVVNSRGALTGREIGFLRSEMGLTPAEFGKLVDREESTVSQWEHDADAPDGTMDLLIRMLATVQLKLDVAPHEISARRKKAARKPRIRITKKAIDAVSMAA